MSNGNRRFRGKKSRQIVLHLDGTLTGDLLNLQGKYVTIAFTSAFVERVEASIAGDAATDVVSIDVAATDVVLAETTPPPGE